MAKAPHIRQVTSLQDTKAEDRSEWQMRAEFERWRGRLRHSVLIPRLLCCFLLALTCWGICWGADAPVPASKTDVAVAKRLSDLAKEAFRSGQTVRAYLLFVEASERNPQNVTYQDNRNALEATAKLLIKMKVETADIAKDIAAAEEAVAHPEPSIVAMEIPSPEVLHGIPHVNASTARHNFNLQGDDRTLFQQVTAAYGVMPAWDPQLVRKPNIHFQLDDADWPTALDALTAATGTFVFPISSRAVFFAADSEEKRNELEPIIVQTVTLPEAVSDKDLVEAANAVRATLNLHALGWNSATRTVLIRDRVTRAHVARDLLQCLLIPKGQVALEVQVLTLDASTTFHYGFSPQAAFQLVTLAHIGNLQQSLPNLAAAANNFLTLGPPGFLVAVGITSSSLFASYSKSFATVGYNAIVTANDGTTANLHVGQKYPIPQSLFTGASQVPGSIYNPIGQITLEDLGLVLKMTPRINGEGEIMLELDAEYKALGSLVLNTVPSVNERKYTGMVTLREGQSAVIAGIDEKSTESDHAGLAGISSIPGLNHLLSENTKTTTKSDTLIVIKPTITRLPMSPTVNAQFFLGPVRGARVIL